jgi:hypothetical protein
MIDVNDVFEALGKEYIALDKTTYENKTYIFTNELDNNEPTKIFKTFKLVENGIVEVKDRQVLSQILPNFHKK